MLLRLWGLRLAPLNTLKKQFVGEGLPAALERKRPQKPPRQVTFDGAYEARLIALACSETPEGRRGWTMNTSVTEWPQSFSKWNR